MHINYVKLTPIVDGMDNDGAANVTGCRITQCIHINLGGSLPGKLSSKIAQNQAKSITQVVAKLIAQKDYFLELYANKKDLIDDAIN